MLESLIQAGAWLIRLTEDFAHSVVVLRQAKGIKYGKFIEPGDRLAVRVELALAQWPSASEIVWLKATGQVNGTQMVSARLGLARYNLADSSPDGLALDTELRQVYRRQLELLLRCDRSQARQTSTSLPQ